MRHVTRKTKDVHGGKIKALAKPKIAVFAGFRRKIACADHVSEKLMPRG